MIDNLFLKVCLLESCTCVPMQIVQSLGLECMTNLYLSAAIALVLTYTQSVNNDLANGLG
jgi:hypothetical protein